MALVFKLDGVTLTNRVRMTGSGDGGVAGLPSAAWLGETATGGVTIDDPEGDLDLTSWHTFTVDETSCSKPRIWGGWLTGRKIRRGPHRTGPGRVWDCDITEINNALVLEVFRSAADSIRPAETDVERIDAALGSGAMSGTPVHDNGRFNHAGPINQSAANFVGQFPLDMLMSAATNAGKNLYCYWDDVAEEISLHYDVWGEGPAAGIGISNVIADVDGSSVFYPLLDAELEQDGSQVATGVLLHWAAGYTYSRNQTLIDELSPTEFSPDEFRRDFAYESTRIGSPTTAQHYVDIALDQRSHDDDTITCAIPVPAEAVNLIVPGDVVTVRFSHLPDYESATEIVCVRRTVVLPTTWPWVYELHLELANFGVVRAVDGGDPGTLPYTPPGEHWYSGTFDVTGDSYAYAPTSRDGWIAGQQYVFQIVVHEGMTYATNVTLETGVHHSGLNSPDMPVDEVEWSTVGGNFDKQTSGGGGGPVTWAGTITIGVTPGPDPTDAFEVRATTADKHHGEGNATGIEFWFDPVTPATDEDPPVVPAAGQWVIGRTPSPPADGSTTTFDVGFAFAAGSLTVFVDNLNQTAAVTDQDPAAGTFTLAFAPDASEQILVNFQAA